MSKNMNILDLIHLYPDDHTEALAKKVEANPDYEKNRIAFYEHLDTLSEWKQMFDLESIVSSMENAQRETAFNEGFRLGVQLMISSLGEGLHNGF